MMALVGSSSSSCFMVPRNKLLVASMPISRPHHYATVVIRCAKPTRPPGSKGKPPQTNGVLRVAERRSVALESVTVSRRLNNVAEDNNNTATAATTQVDSSSVDSIVQDEVISNLYRDGVFSLPLHFVREYQDMKHEFQDESYEL